jgi:hypothetical protein
VASGQHNSPRGGATHGDTRHDRVKKADVEMAASRQEAGIMADAGIDLPDTNLAQVEVYEKDFPNRNRPVIELVAGEPMFFDLSTLENCQEAIARATWSMMAGDVSMPQANAMVRAATAAATMLAKIKAPTLSDSILLKWARAMPLGPDEETKA